MNLLEQAKFIAPDLVEIRRDLHRHPELAFQEVRTAGIAARALENLGCKIRTEIGITGVIADLDNGTGPKVAIRADMDALPMQETSGLPYKSKNAGVMHACGHDGHTAMLLGAAEALSEKTDKLNGTVKFIFQPAEEGQGGARYMIGDGALDGVDGSMAFTSGIIRNTGRWV